MTQLIISLYHINLCGAWEILYFTTDNNHGFLVWLNGQIVNLLQVWKTFSTPMPKLTDSEVLLFFLVDLNQVLFSLQTYLMNGFVENLVKKWKH